MQNILRLLTFAFAVLAFPLAGQDSGQRYEAELLTVAFVPADGPYAGEGQATVKVEQGRIDVAGFYNGLDSPATNIRLLSGSAVGVPGAREVGELQLVGGGARQGSFRGSVKAASDTLRLLAEERIYVRVDTMAAPDGALWGWLMVVHPYPGANVPEKANPHVH